MRKSTEAHKKYWKNRDIDWNKEYSSTWNHPHRQMIIDVLRSISFQSVLELGCASGPNLYRISKDFPGVKIGGIDINTDAIETARSLMPQGVFQVDSVENVFFSDKSVDVVLCDAALIYVGPIRIHKVMNELRRIARNDIILVEFHSGNIFERLGIWWASGYFSYNYKKLLKKYGFYDIAFRKIPGSVWGYPWSKWGFVIHAKI